ncbi:hypothetical protein ACJJTC_000195 [Scirpophaga incertulas]
MSDIININSDLEDLTVGRSYLCSTTDCRRHTILIGDINIDIKENNSDPRSLCYLNLMASHGMLPSHLIPTRLNNCLDHVLVKTHYQVTTLVIESPITDHYPILMNLDFTPKRRSNKHISTKLNLEAIKHDIENTDLSALLLLNDVNEVTNQFINILMSIIKFHSHTITTPCKQRILKPWITPGLLRCIRNRDNMHRKIKENPNSPTLSLTYKRYRNFCNNLLKNLKREYERVEFEKAKNNPKKTWEIIRKVTQTEKSHTAPLELLKIFEDPNESVSSVNTFFANVGKNFASKIPDRLTTPLPQCASSNSMVQLNVVASEIENIIMNLRDDCAVGWDGISTQILKMSCTVLSPILTHICNLAISTGVFPDAFKKAIVHPIFKCGDKHNVNNYRPISVLSTLSKILEKIMNRNLVSFLECYKSISENQFGFRKNRSTEDAINSLVQYVVRNVDSAKKCLAIFLDLSKAFDTVSVPLLLRKLEAVGVGFKGYGLSTNQLSSSGSFSFSDGKTYSITHGSVIIAAITSCTNTSNPSVMLGAGLLAKKAVENGLSVAPYIKTSLSPGSGVVTYYLKESGVVPYLDQLGFNTVGYGCMTCIGNSGPIDDNIANTIEKHELVCCGVLSGNRNFEGRVHPHTRANYLASPPLVIAYALAGTVAIDFLHTPLGKRKDGSPVFLRDIWPTRAEIQAVEDQHVIPRMFKEVYAKIELGSPSWQALTVPQGQLYGWDVNSTYIKKPPFFEGMTKELSPPGSVRQARCLLLLGDSVTTDHISPAGSIARNSPAARFLASRGLTPREFNSYGSRRGNDSVMSRGTFANIRLVNRLAPSAGPRTTHFPSGDVMDIYDAAERYASEGVPLVAIVGKDYGSGSSRDWAAKGPYLLGIRAVIAESFERIHRSNLVGMGVLPLQFLPGDSAEALGLTGAETYDVAVPAQLAPGQLLSVQVSTGKSFQVKARFDTEVDLTYFKNGGILNYMIRKML